MSGSVDWNVDDDKIQREAFADRQTDYSPFQSRCTHILPLATSSADYVEASWPIVFNIHWYHYDVGTTVMPGVWHVGDQYLGRSA